MKWEPRCLACMMISLTGSDVAFKFEEFGHIMTGSVVMSVVMFIAFVAASIYILDKKLNLE